MKNKEYFKKELDELCGSRISINKFSNKPSMCKQMCSKCLFNDCSYLNFPELSIVSCSGSDEHFKMFKEWLEQEHVEEKRFIPRETQVFWFADYSRGTIKPEQNVTYQCDSAEFECYYGMFKHVFTTKEECQEYIDFWKKVWQRKSKFVKGENNITFAITDNWEVVHCLDRKAPRSKYYFGSLNYEEVCELIGYLGEDNIKKFMFGVYE